MMKFIDELCSVRKKLTLAQIEAAESFGGGVNTLSCCESGKCDGGAASVASVPIEIGSGADFFLNISSSAWGILSWASPKEIRMRFNKSQRDGLAKTCDNLASGFAVVSIIGYFGFGIGLVKAIVVFVLAMLCIAAGLAIRSQKAREDD